MIVLFDSVDLGQFPVGPQAVAGYVDGAFANAQALAARFPHARLLTIAVDPAHDAEALDIENGDATPADAAQWFARQVARGVQRPCLYASVGLMQAQVVPVLKAAGIGRDVVRLWTAHYAGLHVCAHDTCGELAFPADGTQWTDRAYGRSLDQSLLAADFFGTVAAPSPATAPSPVPAWQEAMMQALPVLSEGAADQPGHTFFVHRMQALIRVIGEIKNIPEAAGLVTDGQFGAMTGAGLRAVQASFGLTADGVCGEQSWGVLVTGAP